MREEVRKRKERSDKKRDIKPTVPLHLHNCLSDLSYVVNQPIKDVAEFICLEGMQSHRVIEHISPRFKRDYQLNNTHYIGDRNLEHNRYIIRKEKVRKRVSIRFTKEFYEQIDTLSFSLDLTPSSATSVLLEASIKDINIIDSLLKPYTHRLDENKKRVLKDVIKYVRRDNPYIQSVGFMDIVRYFIDWLKMN